MQSFREELAVEPRRLSRRPRLFLAGGMSLTFGMVLLTGSHSTACRPTNPDSRFRSSLSADDPYVRSLHFAALDRAPAAGDVAPSNVLPNDVRQTTRRVGDIQGVAVYLADGPGFACLGVDGRQAQYNSATQCLLDVTIANQGLYLRIDQDGTDAVGQEGGLLIVAVPDHASLLTSASTEQLADYESAVVLRPRQDAVLMQSPHQKPFVVSGPTDPITSARPC